MCFDYPVIDEAAQILKAIALVPVTLFRILSGLADRRPQTECTGDLISPQVEITPFQ